MKDKELKKQTGQNRKITLSRMRFGPMIEEYLNYL